MNATSASYVEINASTAHITQLSGRTLMLTVAAALALPSQLEIVGMESRFSRPFALLLGNDIPLIFLQKVSSIYSCFIILGTTLSNYSIELLASLPPSSLVTTLCPSFNTASSSESESLPLSFFKGVGRTATVWICLGRGLERWTLGRMEMG